MYVTSFRRELQIKKQSARWMQKQWGIVCRMFFRSHVALIAPGKPPILQPPTEPPRCTENPPRTDDYAKNIDSYPQYGAKSRLHLAKRRDLEIIMPVLTRPGRTA